MSHRSAELSLEEAFTPDDSRPCVAATFMTMFNVRGHASHPSYTGDLEGHILIFAEHCGFF